MAYRPNFRDDLVRRNNTLLSRQVPRSQGRTTLAESHKNLTSLIVGHGPFGGGPKAPDQLTRAGCLVVFGTTSSRARYAAAGGREKGLSLRRARGGWHNALTEVQQSNGTQPVKTPLGGER